MANCLSIWTITSSGTLRKFKRIGSTFFLLDFPFNTVFAGVDLVTLNVDTVAQRVDVVVF
ncbi:hypothetical protein LHA01_26600 [Schleiferilactobacillus harbinensis]|nr:hypothetical protein LHA01_26600 [Schleiferilactobacillus harbinensis]